MESSRQEVHAGAANNKETLDSLQDDSELQTDAAQFAILRHRADLHKRDTESQPLNESTHVRSSVPLARLTLILLLSAWRFGCSMAYFKSAQAQQQVAFK